MNGKLKGTILLGSELGNSDEEILNLLRADIKIGQVLDGISPRKIIYKQGKVINIVV